MATISLTTSGTAGIDDITRSIAVQTLLQGLFARLDATNIPWCLLRNRDKVPQGLLTWSDVDLLVSDIVTTSTLIALFADFHPVQIGPIGSKYVSFFFPVEDLFLRVDALLGDMSWYGATYASNQELLASRQNDEGIMVASPLYQAYTTWCSKLLSGGTLPNRYEPLIRHELKVRTVEFRSLLERAFGNNLADMLVALANAGRLQDSGALGSRCQRAIWLRAWRSHPIRMAVKLTNQAAEALGHRVHSSGITVSLLGGNDSQNKLLCKRISRLPSRRIPFSNATFLEPVNLYPTGSFLTSKSGTSERASQCPQYAGNSLRNISPLSRLRELSLQGSLTVGIWRNEIVMSRRQLAHGDLIMRYAHPMDPAIDRTRCGYPGPPWIAELLARLAPKADLIVYLDTPYDINTCIDDRVGYRSGVFRKLIVDSCEAHTVDVNQPFEGVINDVLKCIALYAAERTERTFFPYMTAPP